MYAQSAQAKTVIHVTAGCHANTERPKKTMAPIKVAKVFGFIDLLLSLCDADLKNLPPSILASNKSPIGASKLGPVQFVHWAG